MFRVQNNVEEYTSEENGKWVQDLYDDRDLDFDSFKLATVDRLQTIIHSEWEGSMIEWKAGKVLNRFYKSCKNNHHRIPWCCDDYAWLRTLYVERAFDVFGKDPVDKLESLAYADREDVPEFWKKVAKSLLDDFVTWCRCERKGTLFDESFVRCECPWKQDEECLHIKQRSHARWRNAYLRRVTQDNDLTKETKVETHFISTKSFCPSCMVQVPLVNPTVERSSSNGRTKMLQADCPNCGAPVVTFITHTISFDASVEQ